MTPPFFWIAHKNNVDPANIQLLGKLLRWTKWSKCLGVLIFTHSYMKICQINWTWWGSNVLSFPQKHPYGVAPFTYHLNACISIFRQSEKPLTFSSSTSMRKCLVLYASCSPAGNGLYAHPHPTHPHWLLQEARYRARDCIPAWLSPVDAHRMIHSLGSIKNDIGWITN